jgi:hypothetical protein
MESISATPSSLEIYLDGPEYFALLRPVGMLVTTILAHEQLGTLLQVKRFKDGAVLLVTPEAIEPLVSGLPGHACDDRLRLLVAKWNREFVCPVRTAAA